MSTSKSPLAVPYYAETTEEQEKLNELKEARQRLKDALENRNQLFDPTLLAMAQGFLAPTKTGKFGESLGNVAAAVMPVQQAEEKRSRELAQMQAELAALELAGVQAGAGEKLFRSALLGTQPGAPSGAPAATPSGAPTGTATATPTATPSGEAMRPINEDDIRRIMARYPQYARQLMDLVKMDRDRFKIAMNGTVFDTKTQSYIDTPIPGQKQEPFTTPYGQFNMLPFQYSQFLKAEEKGEGRAYLEKLTGRKLGEPTGAKTPEEQAADAAALKTQQEARAKGEAERFEDRINRGANAGSRIAQYTALTQIAKRPDAAKILGVFEGPGVGDALGKLLETSGKGLPEVKDIRAIFTDLGLDKQLKADQQLAAQLIAQINLELRKITRTPGEGSVSDFETRMILASGLDAANTPQGLVKKIELLKARAEYDRDLSRALRSSGMKVDDFMESARGQEISQKYINRLVNIVGLTPSPTAAGRSKAGDRVRALLGE